MHLKDVIAREHAGQCRRDLAMFLWIFLAFLHVSLISQWLTVSRRDRVFTEYIDHVMRAAANERRSAREVRALLLMKAEDLAVPVQVDGIDITGNGQILKAAVHYKADITMPIVNQSVYRMKFDHDLTLRPLH